MTKILLVDDEPLLLDSLEIILTYSGGYEITGKAGNGIEALSLLSKDVPDVMLVDLNMPGMGGIELIPKVHAEFPDIKIIVLTTFYDERSIAHAIAGGACGYLLKDSGKDAILSAISQALSGRSVLDQKVMQKLNAMLAAGASDAEAGDAAANGTRGAAGNGTGTGSVRLFFGSRCSHIFGRLVRSAHQPRRLRHDRAREGDLPPHFRRLHEFADRVDPFHQRRYGQELRVDDLR